MTPLRRASILALAASASFGSADAQDAPALQLRSLAATCAQCHGTDGRPASGSVVPALAGMAAAYTVEQMTAFKSATRATTVMTQLARGYSDAQIRQLATYFAAQAR